jgi:mannosyltransferase OCH1-like enzyme
MRPKRFIRVWLGNKPIPEIFETWWQQFQAMHPDYEFVTLRDWCSLDVSETLLDVLKNVDTYAGQSDVVRLLALYQIGGIYIDTDVKPLKSFDYIIESDNRPFLGRRSGVSFESAVMGSPQGHIAFKEVLDRLPLWVEAHKDRKASVQTGPAFISSVLFGRSDVRHFPPSAFYPYNGFGAPKRDEKLRIFEENEFPPEMICAHFSNHRWGGNPSKAKSK